MSMFHIIMPLVVRVKLGFGAEGHSAVQTFYPSSRMCPFVNLFDKPVAKGEMAFGTLNVGFLTIERQTLLVDPVATRLAGIAIENVCYSCAPGTEPGLVVQIAVFLGGEDGLTVDASIVTVL